MTNNLIKCCVAGVLLAASSAANAQFSTTITAASDYDFRGVTQSAGDPALQISLDYAFSNGIYIGAWGSNIDGGEGFDADIEVDYYAGIAGGDEDGVQWDFGLVWYSYPGESDTNYGEIYGEVTYGPVSGKLWYSDDLYNSGESAYYVEANGAIPLPAEFSIDIHAGYSFGDLWNTTNDEYYDWSIGVSRTFGKFDFALKYIDGSNLKSLNNTPDDVFSSDDKVFFSVATTFPW